jgi:hypothetical protein
LSSSYGYELGEEEEEEDGGAEGEGFVSYLSGELREKERQELMIERQEPVETGGRAHGKKGPT